MILVIERLDDCLAQANALGEDVPHVIPHDDGRTDERRTRRMV